MSVFKLVFSGNPARSRMAAGRASSARTAEKNTCIAASLILCLVVSARAEVLADSDLRLTPLAPCKGAGRPAPKMKETIHAESVGAPAKPLDLNGDGWCDWIISVGAPINSGLPEYSPKEAILLGTEKGARTFGDDEKRRTYWRKRLPVPDGLVGPDGVTGMAPALVAYRRNSRVPYFIGLSGAYPYFTADADSYDVYRWNMEFDMPQKVGDAEYLTVMKFFRKQYCEGKSYSDNDFMYPDNKNPESPLEIVVCSPQMLEAFGSVWKRLEAFGRVEAGLPH
jgi:hypothetical protein